MGFTNDCWLWDQTYFAPRKEEAITKGVLRMGESTYFVEMEVRTVPKQSLESLTMRAIIPAHMQLSRIRIVKTDDNRFDSRYRLRLHVQVEASDKPTAIRVAYDRAENLVRVLAVSGFNYVVEFSGIFVESELERTARLSAHRPRRGHAGTPPVSAYGISESEQHLTPFDDRALAASGSWPPGICDAMELNRLAVGSHISATSFLLAMTALEALAKIALGPVGTIVGSHLSYERDREKFREALDTLTQDWGFNKGARKRVIGRVFDAENESKASYLLRYLKSVGVTAYSEAQVKAWWKLRGKVAHGHTPRQSSTAAAEVTTALQAALRVELERVI
jgi:hypothetical protein